MHMMPYDDGASSLVNAATAAAAPHTIKMNPNLVSVYLRHYF